MDPATIFLIAVVTVGGIFLVYTSCMIGSSRRRTLDLYREAARRDIEFRYALMAYLLSKPTGDGGHDETDQDPDSAGPASATCPGRPPVSLRKDHLEKLMNAPENRDQEHDDLISDMADQPEFRDLSGDELERLADEHERDK
jgi:hypothetical protein